MDIFSEYMHFVLLFSSSCLAYHSGLAQLSCWVSMTSLSHVCELMLRFLLRSSFIPLLALSWNLPSHLHSLLFGCSFLIHFFCFLHGLPPLSLLHLTHVCDDWMVFLRSAANSKSFISSVSDHALLTVCAWLFQQRCLNFVSVIFITHEPSCFDLWTQNSNMNVLWASAFEH